MRRRYLHAALLLALAIGLAGLVNKIMKPDHPRVSATVGQSIVEIQKHSTYPFSLKGQNDNSPFVVQTPVQLEYGQGPARLSLPPGSYLWLSQLGGRIYELQFAPHLEALTWEQALPLCSALLERLKSSPWQPERPQLPSEKELRQNFDVASRELYSTTIQSWRLDDSRLRLTLKRVSKPEDPDDPEYFMVLLAVDNDALRDKLLAQVKQKRESRGGSPDDPLSLEEWLKDTP